MDLLYQEGNPVQRKRRFSTILLGWLTKNWKPWLPILISLIAVIASIVSCNISKKANQLSKQAIETSSDEFFKENKPYIIIKPRKFSELQSYYKYTLLPQQNAVKIQLQYEVKNIGRVAAKDLAVFDKLQVGKSSTKPEFKEMNLPNKITLGPGENYILTMESLMGWDNKDSFEEYVQKLSSKKGPEITIQMGVTYLSELNPKQSFSSATANKITKERAQIIKIEYEEE